MVQENKWSGWMELALQQAQKAFLIGEVPVGALLLDQDETILALDHNRPIAEHDPTAHAEILVLRQGAQKKENYRLTGTTLICTLEPCIMCLGSMIQARISGLVFAARDPKYGAIFSRFTYNQDFNWLNHQFWIIEGPLKEKSRQLLQDFFAQRRKNKRRGSEVRS